jgi:hypothetical protein
MRKGVMNELKIEVEGQYGHGLSLHLSHSGTKYLVQASTDLEKFVPSFLMPMIKNKDSRILLIEFEGEDAREEAFDYVITLKAALIGIPKEEVEI